MKLNNFIDKLKNNIEIGEVNSPVLFDGQNLELLNGEVKNIAQSLMNEYEVPLVNLFVLEDNGEKIKIDEIKRYLEHSNTTTPYKFQIFLIENISRMTIQSTNSCLKFFEEPGTKNLIFLTNKGESGVLDTILSRVQQVNLGGSDVSTKDEFYYSSIKSHLSGGNDLVTYFFKSKLEKHEYTNFLKTLIIYIKENLVYINYLEEIEDDLNGISNNNVNARGVIDKWILKLS